MQAKWTFRKSELESKNKGQVLCFPRTREFTAQGERKITEIEIYRYCMLSNRNWLDPEITYPLHDQTGREYPLDLNKFTWETICGLYTSAGVFPINPDGNRVLLGEHIASDGGASLWAPPAGRRESNELPPETAIREGQEELGLTCKVEQLFNPLVIVNATSITRLKISVLFPLVIFEETKFGVPNEELKSVRWFGYDALMQYVLDSPGDASAFCWGGESTGEALYAWIYASQSVQNGREAAQKLGGMVALFSSSFGAGSRYAKMKALES